MDDDQSKLEHALRDKAGEVPYLQEAPPKMLARARRRVARNALSSVVVVGLVVAGASGLLGLGAFRGSNVTPGGSISVHPSSPVPSTSPCAAADLKATPALDGAAGSVVGAIDLTNVGAATCTLAGRPTLSITSSTGQAVSVQVSEVPAQWQVDGSAAPNGWPVVSLRSGDAAAIRIRWSNACPQLTGPASWSVDLGDGGGSLDVSGTGATFPPPCNGPGEPSTLEVGPFEPAAGA